MKRPSLKVEKWMRETLTWLAREGMRGFPPGTFGEITRCGAEIAI